MIQPPAHPSNLIEYVPSCYVALVFFAGVLALVLFFAGALALVGFFAGAMALVGFFAGALGLVGFFSAVLVSVLTFLLVPLAGSAERFLEAP